MADGAPGNRGTSKEQKRRFPRILPNMTDRSCAYGPRQPMTTGEDRFRLKHGGRNARWQPLPVGTAITRSVRQTGRSHPRRRNKG